MRQIVGNHLVNVHDQAARLTEATLALSKNGGFTYDGLNKSRNELEDAGLDLHAKGKIEKLIEVGKTPIKSFVGNKDISLSAPQQATDSVIGTDTFEISNQLIQDISPENSIENSPFNLMMPFKTIDGIQYQQDIMSSFYGWADGGSSINGAINVVPLLETISNSWKGFDIAETSYLEGKDLIALREVGVNDPAKRGALQKLNYGMLNLLQRAGTGLELNRIEALLKGSWTWYEGSTDSDVTISQAVPAGNVTSLSQSLGSYVTATNVFTPNPTLTINPLVELGQMLTQIKNMGLEIEKIVLDNIVYSAIFSCSAVTSQTQYVTMNSDNNVMGVRANLFRITTIPELQDVPIEVDNRAVKINSNTTTRENTRPLLWGKTVTPSSFRALIVIRPSGLTRVGDFGFFPNTYARTTQIAGGSRSVGGYGGGIVMVQQDLSVMDITRQKIQILAASSSSPMTYLPNLVFPFDWNVPVS